MLRTVLKSKIHRLTVTGSNADYVGSISLGGDLMEAAEIHPFEQVHVVNISNGNRLSTYAVLAQDRPGEVCLNGAAARLNEVGDIVIVMNYCLLDEIELEGHDPLIIFVNNKNEIVSKKLASVEKFALFE